MRLTANMRLIGSSPCIISTCLVQILSILVVVADYLQFRFSGVTLSLSAGGSLQC